ncbi:hypothetical protein NESM_000710000 [Novymonas esmeraldas]|uniref:Uncharacterized protein n=1 Tax=Novymonas esmeraldas TaxID=1808958 RepID=A0AAW0EXJ7_9TRYP
MNEAKMQSFRVSGRKSLIGAVSQDDSQGSDAPLPFRRYLPRPVEVPTSFRMGAVDVASPVSLFAPLLPDVVADAGLVISSPYDENDFSSPFPVMPSGAASPICRLYTAVDYNELTMNSARFEKEDADEHVHLVHQYMERFKRRQRHQQPSTNSSTGGASFGADRDGCSIGGTASQRTAAAAYDLALFQVASSEVDSTRSLRAFGNLSTPRAYHARDRQRYSLNGCAVADFQNMTISIPSLRVRQNASKSIGGSTNSDIVSPFPGRSVVLSSRALRPRNPHRASLAPHRLCIAKERRSLRAPEADAAKSQASQLSHSREANQRFAPPRSRLARAQGRMAESDSFTLGVDDTTSGSSW